ncbi:hypothetical protein KCP76_19185 [Salmonella enterica subsp. enterica serovar Weltevreden]|nr:hypothetical protein KCP76_19185 [Salmonella enterica subsp. enterica serovar Weltevreden]
MTANGHWDLTSCKPPTQNAPLYWGNMPRYSGRLVVCLARVDEATQVVA